MWILIAEDDDISRQSLSAMLQKQGHEVLETSNGDEAWQKMQAPRAPKLLVLDIMMPGMDGLELCRQLRSLETWNPPYIILLTAKTKKEDVIQGLEAGANDYITKPYNFGELKARINVGQRMLEMQSTLLQELSERRQAEEELRQLRNYLSNIIDSMPSMLIGVDPDGNITQWNLEAEKNTGLSSKDTLGYSLDKVLPRLSAEMDRVREAMETQRVQSQHRRALRQDGHTIYEDLTVYPLIGNGVTGAVIRLDDVTEKVRMEEMMIQSEKMLSIGGLAAGTAHEINNPLGGMMQTAEVISNRLTDPNLPANQRAAEKAGISMQALNTYMEERGITKMLARILDSGKRASEIVTNMLSFARKSEAEFSSQDLAELLEQTVNLAGSDYDLKKKYDFRNIEILREYQKDLPYVRCEKSKIQQVILNILTNGAEAMQKAQETELAQGDSLTGDSEDKVPNSAEIYKPCFVLRLLHEKEIDMLRIEIEDNGPGMDETTRKRAFEPFFTTKSVGVGTGLGLSVSYFIVTKNHGGEMDLESFPGKGSKFVIKLPVKGYNNE